MSLLQVKRMRKYSKTAHINRLRKLLSEGVRLRDKKCQYCGESWRKMDCSHIWPKGSFPAMQFLPENVKLLCSFPCHNLWWHGNPAESGQWVKIFLGEKMYENLLKRSQMRVTVNRIFLEQTETELKQWLAMLRSEWE